MIIPEDIKKKSKDKYGFKVTLSENGITEILKKSLLIPEGELERVHFDPERATTTLYYRSEKPIDTDKKTPCAGRIGEAGEYPERCEPKIGKS